MNYLLGYFTATKRCFISAKTTFQVKKDQKNKIKAISHAVIKERRILMEKKKDTPEREYKDMYLQGETRRLFLGKNTPYFRVKYAFH